MKGGVVVHFNPAEEEVWLIKQYCVFVPQTSMHIYPYTKHMDKYELIPTETQTSAMFCLV